MIKRLSKLVAVACAVLLPRVLIKNPLGRFVRAAFVL